VKSSRPLRPNLEAMESKALLSAVAASAPGAAAIVATPHTLVLNGTLSGRYSAHQSNPDAGKTYDLSGSGRVLPLRHTGVAGNLRTVGFIANRHAEGTLSLSDSQGTVTIRLVGPPQSGPTGLPPRFHFTITGGTGRYQGVKGQGTAALTLVPSPNASNAAIGVTHGTFKVVLVGDVLRSTKA